MFQFFYHKLASRGPNEMNRRNKLSQKFRTLRFWLRWTFYRWQFSHKETL